MIDEQDFHRFATWDSDISISEMPYTYNREGSIDISQLKKLHFIHRTFLGDTKIGVFVVNKKILQPLSEILRIAYDSFYPIHQAKTLDSEEFKGDDNSSMSANNSSCFNDRLIAGTDFVSQHALGLAVDINPLLNPYLAKDSCWYPPAGFAYTDRSRVSLGMFTEDHVVTQAFIERGFQWGGSWERPDYHHFEFNN